MLLSALLTGHTGHAMYKLFVALRYLRRNWLNIFGVLAVALSVLVLICVLSVMKGFDQEFRARLRATVSDLVIESWSDDSFTGYQDIMRDIATLPHVAACAPRFEGLALIRLDSSYGKQRRVGQFNGVDLKREIRATDFLLYWRAWRGKEARERIQEIQLLHERGEASLETLSREDFSALLGGLRPEDVNRLTPKDRKALRKALKRHAVMLQDVYQQSDKEELQWGSVTDEGKESPAILGAELAVVGRDPRGGTISLGLDERVVVFTPTDLFDGRAIRRCRIKGKFHSGLYDYDLRNIYLPLQDVQEFMNKKGHVTSINVRLDSFDNAPAVRAALLGILTPEEMRAGLRLAKPRAREHAERIAKLRSQIERLDANIDAWFLEGSPYAVQGSRLLQRSLFALVHALVEGDVGAAGGGGLEALRAFRDLIVERERKALPGDFRVSTWQDKRRTFLRAVELERRIMAVILAFVILIAGFLILAILHTTVVAKTRDVGTLKSIGGTARGIMAIFLLNGFLIGVIGSCLGAVAGILITKYVNEIEAVLHRIIGFSLFPSNIYYLDRIPTEKDPAASIITICVSVLVVSLLASAVPAWKASRMDPVEALRHE